MKKYIYKITNKLNQKVYIGQTNNLERRKSEHFRCLEKNKILYEAIKKYGKENFTFECIEDLCSDYNEKEKYWINYYRSYIGFDDCKGYNETLGGEEPPIKYGEANNQCIHSDKIVNLVISYLLDTNLSVKEIAKITGYTNTAIRRINNGELRKKDNLIYPLRKEISFISLNERAKLIIEELKNSNLTQKEIAEKYNVKRTTVTAINNGQNHKQENIDYPIRKEAITGGRKPKKVVMCDIKSLKPIKTFNSSSDAAKYFGKNRGDCINTSIKNNKTCWGYKWKYFEEE